MVASTANASISYKKHTHGDGKCAAIPVYHTHTGSDSWGNASGCYETCGNTWISVKDYWWTCDSCGTKIVPYDKSKPDKCGAAILTCTKTSSTIDSYYCNITEGTILSATIVFN